MATETKNINFEIHLTASEFGKSSVEDFISVCRKIGGTPLFIELNQGEYSQQPMLSKTVSAKKLETVLHQANYYAQKFTRAKFNIARIKIEVDEKYAFWFKKSRENYFEWHGKIYLDDLPKVFALCEKHKAHLSKNSLKGELNHRFITLRDFESKISYQNRLTAFKKDLEHNLVIVYKELSEFCVYDSNQILDKGWIYK